jgi:hypothetical protein
VHVPVVLDLEVVGPHGRVARVPAHLGLDRGASARCAAEAHVEEAAAGERPGVRLVLEVALVLEPVPDVDDQGDEEQEHGQEERDGHQDAAVLRAGAADHARGVHAGVAHPAA